MPSTQLINLEAVLKLSDFDIPSSREQITQVMGDMHLAVDSTISIMTRTTGTYHTFAVYDCVIDV